MSETKHKHRLYILENEDALLESPEIHKLLAYFACEVCGRHFYIQKTDLVKHLTGEIKRPFRLNRGMFVKDGDDNWQLVFTVVS